MRATVTQIRRVIREELEDQRKLRYLEAASKRKYLVGQWVKLNPYAMGRRHTEGECWEAEDPSVGKVYLVFRSSTSYKKAGRLRITSGTRYSWTADLATVPWGYGYQETTRVFSISTTGEGQNQYDKEDQVSKRMVKQFGIDPYEYKRPKPAPEAAPAAAPAEVPPEASSPAPAAPVPGAKSYKVYGRRGNAPATTRVKGKVYLAPGDTQFKAGDQAEVEPRDGKLRVKRAGSDHEQTWDPE